MDDLVNGIHNLNEKSQLEDRNIEGIKEFINYKYPNLPMAEIQGQILSKVDSKWDEGVLDEMKSRTRSR